MTGPGDEEVLRRRAIELARPPEAEEQVSRRELMRFRLGEESYAVPIDVVRQVVALAGAARLPRAAWPLVALAPVAGAIVPVVALGRDAPTSAPWAVAVAAGDTVVCLPADEVVGMAAVRETDVTTRDTDGDIRYARGLTHDGDVLIDVEVLVASIEDPDMGRPTGQAGTADDA